VLARLSWPGLRSYWRILGLSPSDEDDSNLNTGIQLDVEGFEPHCLSSATKTYGVHSAGNWRDKILPLVTLHALSMLDFAKTAH
jgi:hypothetical protein